MSLSSQPEGEDRALRRGRRSRWWRWSLVAALLVAAVAVAVAALSGALAPATVASELPRWREELASLVLVPALALIVVGSVIYIASGMFGLRSLEWMRHHSLTRRQQAARCVRRGQGVPQEIHSAAVATARAWVRQCRGLPLYAGAFLAMAGTAVRVTNPWWAVLAVLGVAVLLALLLSVAIAGWCGRRWLQAYPEAAANLTGATS